MKKLFIIILIIGFFLPESFCISICSSHNRNYVCNFDPHGEWVVFKYMPAAISEITDEEAKAFIGNTVVLDLNFAVIFNDTCNRPTFNFKTVNSNLYFFSNNRKDKETLNIKQDSIMIMEVGCGNIPKYFSEASPEFSYDFIVLGNESMIFNYKGIYFFLKKAIDVRNVFNLSGTGKFEKKITLPSESTLIKIEYDFYEFPNQLIIENSDGCILFKTDMTSTKKAKHHFLKIDQNIVNTVIKIEVLEPEMNSRWKITLTLI
jgi:hypothetical protein